eukprot:11209932-Lingulodinium_polyedra.AAC.1
MAQKAPQHQASTEIRNNVPENEQQPRNNLKQMGMEWRQKPSNSRQTQTSATTRRKTSNDQGQI